MTIGRILFLMSALAFSQAGMANHQASDKNSAADKMWVLDAWEVEDTRKIERIVNIEVNPEQWLV